MFRALGYSMLLVDYRGYGKSSGSPSEEGTYRDAIASWSWLTETRGVRGRDVLVSGEPLGGAVACWLAAHLTPGALILASAFTSVPDPVRRNLSLFARAAQQTVQIQDEFLPKVSVPVLVIHSPRDEIVPFSHGKRLYEVAREPKQFLEVGGGHNGGFVFMQVAWVSTFGVFLEGAPWQTGVPG